MALYAYARQNLGHRSKAEAAVLGFLDFIKSEQLGFGHHTHQDRLRAFLLSGFQEFLALEAMNGKTSGGRSGARLDFDAAEQWFRSEASGDCASETTFHRAWARCVLIQSRRLLREELIAGHGEDTADTISEEISLLERRPFNPDLAPKLLLAPSEVLDLLRSARRRLRELINETIRETVSSGADVEVEFWDLFKSV